MMGEICYHMKRDSNSRSSEHVTLPQDWSIRSIIDKETYDDEEKVGYVYVVCTSDSW